MDHAYARGATTVIQATYDLAQGNTSWYLLWHHITEREYSTVQRDRWTTETPVTDTGCENIYLEINIDGTENIVATDKAIARIEVTGGQAYVTAAANNQQHTQALIDQLKKAVPPVPEAEHGKRPISFWTLSHYGPEQKTRRVTVPSWNEIKQNYGETQTSLEQLMHYTPDETGQLVLWRGQPGTGKTWALRSLIWEWRNWCDFHYIVDPDKFFGESANYLTTVLFHNNSPTPGQEPIKEDRWKTLILEDCGELISRDARERTGQGLSRLLNTVDGLIGQGLRILLLVTTNEELSALHQAVSRPGRCIANIEFTALTNQQAQQWLQNRNQNGMPLNANSYTIASLYAHINGKLQTNERKPTGFSA